MLLWWATALHWRLAGDVVFWLVTSRDAKTNHMKNACPIMGVKKKRKKKGEALG
jgi:hypothetical protein